MSSTLAFLLCILFILCLFTIDFKRKPNISPAMWLPLFWMILSGSRSLSQWLNPGAPLEQSPEQYLDGNPFDRNVYIVLIVTGVLILLKRKINWAYLLKKNFSFVILFLYFGLSILWSDFPFVSFKRWTKDLGSVVIVLVVLTDTSPVEALKTMIKRCAYVLIPLSITLNRYFPELSRQFSRWEGAQTFTGVTNGKNSLGWLCLICGLFFCWNLIAMWQGRRKYLSKKEFFIHLLFIFMTLYTLIQASSATSLGCLIAGTCIVLLLGVPIIKKNIKFVGAYIVIALLTLLILQGFFESNQMIVTSLGRDMTLTGRTDLWKDLLAIDINPLIGTGYESFWLGERLEMMWDKHFWLPRQAHNGYLEIYLNLGLIGLFLLTNVIMAVYKKCRKELLHEFDYGRFCLAFLFIFLVFNITEAAFKHLHLMWFIFLLIAIEYKFKNNAKLKCSTN